MSLSELSYRTVEKVLPEDLLKLSLIYILLALDFLYIEAKIVYTKNNIMLSIEDKLILVEFEEVERSSPSSYKIIRNQVIYSSRDLEILKGLFERKHLLYARNSNRKISDSHHLARIINSEYTIKFFDRDDIYRGKSFYMFREARRQFARYTIKFISLFYAEDALVATGKSSVCEGVTSRPLA
ncbi:protein kinase [Penicillium daleae]|uniref:Protein kinase n=1 Tax=Penicillium daleae TaxID=63821 RepID=A0AAD6CDA6_9EURO|nr:protein kinase [Penicillium daleae]KAJ5461176.1 protein kinase [Penicillium daleae]